MCLFKMKKSSKLFLTNPPIYIYHYSLLFVVRFDFIFCKIESKTFIKLNCEILKKYDEYFWVDVELHPHGIRPSFKKM